MSIVISQARKGGEQPGGVRPHGSGGDLPDFFLLLRGVPLLHDFQKIEGTVPDNPAVAGWIIHRGSDNRQLRARLQVRPLGRLDQLRTDKRRIPKQNQDLSVLR